MSNQRRKLGFKPGKIVHIPRKLQAAHCGNFQKSIDVKSEKTKIQSIRPLISK